MEAEHAPKPVHSKLMTMMVLRVILALAFLGVTTWAQLTESSLAGLNFHPLYAIVVVVCVLTIVYARTIGRVRNLRLFAYLQVFIDITLITGIVYVTGGVASYLQIMYLLSVMGGCILLGRRGGYITASAAAIAYGTLVDLDFYGMLPARFMVFGAGLEHAWVDVLTTLSTNILAFFIVAFLTGYLAESTARVEKKLEEKEVDLERLERLNRSIVENISSGIMTLDTEGRITSFNNAAEAMTGYTLKELYYTGVDKLFPGIIDDDVQESRTGMRLERTFKRKDSTELCLGFTISRGQGNEAAHIVIFQDLTELKAMEDKLRTTEKLRALGELSVGIAHEVRNPLASISGSIQVLKDDLKLGVDDTRLMEIVLRETERLNLLITDFLLFARPAREKRQVVSLADVISEKLEIFKYSPESEGIAIEADLAPGVFIEADPRQIGQVFLNLFLNSAQAMGHVGTLSVRATVGHEPGDWHATQGGLAQGGPVAEVLVKDTGTGITDADRALIFDPFYSTKESGTGLGLAIAHRIVESHGGSIDIMSAPGEGAEFRITLPLECVQVGAGRAAESTRARALH